MAKVDLIDSHQLPIGRFEVYNERPQIQNLCSIHQTHSSIIKEVSQTYPNEVEGDGIILFNEDIKKYSLAVKTADCLPIVLIGKKGVALIHAGWKGLFLKILQSKELQELQISYAYIGPSIQSDAFEVQADFRENFKDSSHFIKSENKLYFNLQAEAMNQLKESFPNIKIEASKECTYKNHSFNSYRRDKTTKRNWNIFTV